jgi:hypothetical protein
VASEATAEAPESRTVVLKRIWPLGHWLRTNFTLPAMITIVTILGGAAMYIINLRTRVTVLEQTVTIVQKVAPDETALAVIRQRVDDHDRRLADIEGAWKHAATEASKQPPPAPPARRKGR